MSVQMYICNLHIHVNLRIHVHTFTDMYTYYVHIYRHCSKSMQIVVGMRSMFEHASVCTGWLRLVGSLKL